MEKQSSNKKSNVFQIILYTVVVALIVTVVLQNHHINTLKKEDTEITVVEHAADKKDLPTVDIKEYQDKINKPEFKTNDSNSGQVVIEDSFKKAEEEIVSAQPSIQREHIFEQLTSMMQNNPVMEDMIRTQLKSRVVASYDSFAEEYNLSPETKASLVDLLVEKQLETLDMASQIGELQRGNITREDLKQEAEYVNKIYDEKISELLSKEEFAAYKEYAKVEPERLLLDEYKNNTQYGGGVHIDKQQERDMIAAMYVERLKFEEIQKENQQTINPQDLLSKENLKKSVALQSNLLNGYLESSTGILSDSEQDKFSMFIDSKKSMLAMSAQLLGASGGETKDK